MRKQQHHKTIFGLVTGMVICTHILVANGYTLPRLINWEDMYEKPEVDLTDWSYNIDVPPLSPLDRMDMEPIYIEDTIGTPNGHNIQLDTPKNIVKDVTYDPETKQYILTEKVGGRDIKPPVYMSSEEYLKYRGDQDQEDYFRQRFEALTMFDRKPKLPEMPREGLFDRLFGSNKISIKPQGNMELMFGYRYQRLQNPQVPERTQKQGNFDFDMNMNVNLIAEVGDKLKLNINNKTNPSFGETNRQKIEFTGKEDQILKKIELGNTDFNLNSSLISGVKSLYGIKTQLQFGKLWLTGALSQQRSQRKSITIEGGGLMNEFNINADNYDENRNFLLAQYFHDNYETALQQFPLINSQVIINKVEVWVTNRTGATQNVRDIAAFMDLGERQPYLSFLDNGGQSLPSNQSNQLYQLLQQRQSGRIQSTSTQTLMSLGLQEGQDFQRSTMRQLNPSEFTFNPKLGYISLNTQVNTDDVVAVAYRYTYKGEVYQVGEFAEEVPPEDQSAKVMYLKLLKGTSARPKLPIWNLMMKNVYSIGSSSISPEKFTLNIMYLDPGGGSKRYLPEGDRAGEPILRLLNLDRLNPQGDPIPDGIFDFVEGITINPQNGKIIFPVLEPFADGIKSAFGGNTQLERKYLYNQLYDSTKTIAKQFAQYNRFVLSGRYKGRGGNDVSLGGFGIPEGSVVVNAGGQLLKEGVDYTVDYSMGRLRITNEGILQSGVPINVSFEDNTTFSLMQQNFMGLRADYYANNKLILGGTIMRLTERPYTTSISYGDDPIRNTVGGLDLNYQSESKFLTRLLDKLPIYSTTAPSLVAFRVEGAGIFPGHSKLLNSLDPEGSTFIDNFESANSSIDLRTPLQAWNLSSVPVGVKNGNGATLFPNAANGNELSSGYDRAKISWYNIDQRLIEGSFNTPDNIKEDTVAESYWRQVYTDNIFPDKETTAGMNMLSTFDISYFPKERGPYNFSTNNVDGNGYFTNPQDKFGGIQRALDNNNSDFEQSNVEYITFWVLDPFLYKPNSTGGDLYINLGSVSEDVLKDSRMAFENGIPYPMDMSKLNETNWGYVPAFSQQITKAFENDPNSRAIQDVGYDGLDDEGEKAKFADFLRVMEGVLGANSEAYLKLLNDPSSDNFKHYRGNEHDANKHGVITRYKDINSPHGNTPIAEGNEYANAIKNNPESEDINNDNTLNEQESYYSYRIPMMPNTHPSMQVGQNNIVSIRRTNVKLKSGREQEEVWYQYKIPLRGYNQAVGGINDFRSIRFFRMFLTGFQDSVTMRFAELQLDRNLWRTYQYSLKNPGEFIPLDQQQQTKFAINSVSIEQNSSKEPVNYQSPPGVERQRMISGYSNQSLRQNEQSLSMEICGLKDGDSRAAFSERSLDLRQNKYIRAFVHAASVPGQPVLKDDDLYLFMRIGSDFISNYYEYRIPLKVTQPGDRNIETVWPEANRININIEDLVNAKTSRNDANIPSFFPYQTTDDKGNAIIVIGNPNLGNVRNVMLGVSNPSKADNLLDDGMDKCAEIWVDELRVAGFDEQAGYATAAQANIQLADLGNVNFSGSYSTIGYGNINQRVNQRSREELYAFNINTNLNLGKLMPKKWNVILPAYLGYTENVSNPEYDPYDLDIKLKDKLKRYDGTLRDSMLNAAQTFTSTTSFNLNNIRINGNPEKQGKPKPWNLKNFDASYAYNRIFNRSPFLESDEYVDQRFGLGYAYNFNTKPWEPFKKRIKSKNKWLVPIKDFNITPLPKTFTFRNNVQKLFGETIVRDLDESPYGIDPTYYKNFIWDRNYVLSWELTKSLNFNYSGVNKSRVDEPYGRIDSDAKRDTLWDNIMRFGRNTYYSQDFRGTYTVPTKKIPALDWTTATLTYGSTYSWTGAAQVAYNLGHTIANTQTKQLNLGMNFNSLYNKSRHLKVINYPSPRREEAAKEREREREKENKDAKGGQLGAVSARESVNRIGGNRDKFGEVPPRPERKDIPKSAVKGADTMSPEAFKHAWDSLKLVEKKRHKKELVAWRAKRKSILPDVSDAARGGIRLLTVVKNANIAYSEKSGTVLPGFVDSSRFFGSSMRYSHRWYDFAFGRQPDEQWIDSRIFYNQFSKDSMFNQEMKQECTRTLSITSMLEPVPNFRIDLNVDQNFSKFYKALNKYDETTGEFDALSPYTNGMYSASFIGIKSFFKSTNDNYDEFLNNRTTVSRRLGDTNPYVNGTNDPNNPNYKKGYTAFSQDVVIPSFLAAYTGRNANGIPLLVNNTNSVKENPFRNYLPMPNWRINYNGLAKTPLFSEKFSVINVRHSYRGTLAMNSFGSNLMYRDFLGVGFPSFIDSTSGNFIPFYQIPNMTITESFAPIAGFDFTMKSGFSFKVEYHSSRMLSLSLIDYQISETKSKEFVIGFGHRLKGLNLPFPLFGVTQLKNDVNIKVDFSLKDDITRNMYFALGVNQITRGQKVITFIPVIDYSVNENLQIRIYADYRKAMPHVMTSYPVTNLNAGFKLIYMFSPN